MKTDLVEIFQTIRASLQPYATRGYAAHKNSETEYDLWSEKNMMYQEQKITERFFAGVFIEDNSVIVKLNNSEFEGLIANNKSFLNQGINRVGIQIVTLEHEQLKEVENTIAILHNHFKEKEWV